MFSWITDLDINTLYYIQGHFRNELLNSIVKVFTSLGNYGLIWILLTIFLLVCKKTRKTGIVCAIALIIDLVICNGILKNIFARTRPYDAYKDIRCLIEPQPDYSFPSGHTASSFAAVVPILADRNTRRLGIVALVVAILMALSRIYVCVHYPSDVLAGVIVGIFCGVLACMCYKMKGYSATKNKSIIH